MIKEIKFETCALPGPFIGVPSYVFEFDKTPASTGEIADGILSVRDHSAKSKTVIFEGEFSSLLSNEIFTLAKTLKDYGYALHVVADGSIYHSWFNLVDWLIVNITTEPWAGFKCQEVIFKGFKDGDVEPIVFNEGNKHPACYLKPDKKKATKGGIIKFLYFAKLPWNVALPVSKAFSDTVYQRTVANDKLS